MKDAPNIVLLVFDTMRRDALEPRDGDTLAPNLETFAREAVVYPNAIAPSPWTVPSHASFFSGRYPSEHGVHETPDRKVPQMIGLANSLRGDTLPERFRRRGYNTIGFSTNPHISPGSGFDRGFNSFTYVDSLGQSALERKLLRGTTKSSSIPRRRGEVFRDLISQGKFSELFRLYSVYRKTRGRMKLLGYPLVKGGDRMVSTLFDTTLEQPFFLFMNFMEMHDPYTSWEADKEFYPIATDLFGTKKIPPRIMQRIRERYFSTALGALDRFFGNLMQYLRELGAYDNTLVVVTSDHGQALKEHGFFGHGIYLYDEILEVPLIVKCPKGKTFPVASGYQSLVDLPGLIEALSSGDDDAPADPMTRSAAFSEAYGIQFGLETLKSARTREIDEKREVFDTARKAVYRDGYKLVVNGASGAIEEFSRQGVQLPQQAQNEEVLRELLQELAIFRGTEKFAVPARIGR